MRRSDPAENWEGSLAYRLCKCVSRSVPLLTVNSNAGLAYYDAEGFRCQRHVLVPNGADTEEFRPDPNARERVRAQWGVSQSDKLIGLVGRINPVKGHATFLRAASALCKERNSLRFVVVGDGPEPYKGELRRLATELALCFMLPSLQDPRRTVEQYRTAHWFLSRPMRPEIRAIASNRILRRVLG